MIDVGLELLKVAIYFVQNVPTVSILVLGLLALIIVQQVLLLVTDVIEEVLDVLVVEDAFQE